jgi:hypothetical protein
MKRTRSISSWPFECYHGDVQSFCILETFNRWRGRLRILWYTVKHLFSFLLNYPMELLPANPVEQEVGMLSATLKPPNDREENLWCSYECDAWGLGCHGPQLKYQIKTAMTKRFPSQNFQTVVLQSSIWMFNWCTVEIDLNGRVGQCIRPYQRPECSCRSRSL